MSGLTISKIVSLWGFQVDDKALVALDQKLQKLKSSVKAVGLSAVGSAASIFGLAHFTGEAGMEIQKASDRIGISVEALQQYQFAARQSGLSNEEFQSSLEGMTKALFDARNGMGTAGPVFSRLGAMIGKDLINRGTSAEEVLLGVADGLRQIQDPMRRIEYAQRVGVGGMLPLLLKGSDGIRSMAQEAKALGGVMSGSTVAASVQYHAELERAKTVVLGLRNALGLALFPVLERVMGAFRRWVSANRGWIQMRLAETFRVLETYISRVVTVIEQAARLADKGAKMFGGWNRVLKMVTTSLLVMLGIRTAAFVGQMVSAGMALLAFGAEGALAAAPFIALGAAILGVIVALQDIYTYTSGKGKSFTGYLLKGIKDSHKGLFDGLFDGINQWLDKIDQWLTKASDKLDKFVLENIDKFRDFGKHLGESIVGAIDKIVNADWGKAGDAIEKGLNILGDLGKIGLAIADGIIKGLESGLRKRSPEWADRIFGTPEVAGPPAPPGLGNQPKFEPPSLGDFASKAFEGSGLKDIWTSMMSLVSPSSPSLAPAFAGAGGVVVNSPVTVNVAGNLSPEKAAKAVQDGIHDAIKEHLSTVNRQTSAALTNPGER